MSLEKSLLTLIFHSSIAAIRQFLRRYNAEEGRADKITLLEALSASGLRSIRYAKEIPGLSDIVANDFSKKAVESIERNVSANGVSDVVRASNADAAALMYSRRKAEERFTIVDLDPYGSAAPFLDAAVQVELNILFNQYSVASVRNLSE